MYCNLLFKGNHFCCWAPDRGKSIHNQTPSISTVDETKYLNNNSNNLTDYLNTIFYKNDKIFVDNIAPTSYSIQVGCGRQQIWRDSSAG